MGFMKHPVVLMHEVHAPVPKSSSIKPPQTTPINAPNPTTVDQQKQLPIGSQVGMEDFDGPVIPIVVIACNRAYYLEQCLDSLLQHRPNTSLVQFPIFVSQDCNAAEVTNLLQSKKYADKITRMKFSGGPKMEGYEAIARHYKWALQQIFNERHFASTIIVEDDMEVSPDFYEYFIAGEKLLKEDDTIWCISSWNDNGMDVASSNVTALFRTDVFPGLGWMLLRTLWDELEPNWPVGYWDEFMRLPEIRKDRSCVRPEVCRTANFGEIGVSLGQFYNSHIRKIKKNTEMINWSQVDLSYLHKDAYDSSLALEISRATLTDIDSINDLINRRRAANQHGILRVPYLNQNHFEGIARFFQIMDEFKNGLPRASYHGVLSITYRGTRVLITDSRVWRT
ncbi:alpha-1,3-mannosyl-glycoprotein 2-beta-N-acetylglucosaminyltransferase [Pelomyxa schiedti]|nr:alpha-1,3-mannosyl-glycoprotein 2-beta-N-acetylglucosaminyltransferase [Pelomyxa schiedti]